MNRRYDFWRHWLMGATAITIFFGLALVALPDQSEGLFGWLLLDGDTYADRFGNDGADYVAFLTGVLGAVIAGWGVLMAVIVARPLRNHEPWAWWALFGSLLFWFVVDSVLSLVSGYRSNVALNVVFLVAFLIPLIGLRMARGLRP